MISFNNFFEDDIKEIMKALLFVRAKIEDYYEKLGEKVSPEFRKPIRDANQESVAPLNSAMEFLKENEKRRIIPMEKNQFSSLMDVVASALTVYRNNLEFLQKITNVNGYREQVSNLDKILAFGDPAKAKKDMFLKYSPKENQKNNEQVTNREFFISYKDSDRDKACEIKRLLIANSELDQNDVFVAHRDIPLAKKWRDDIISHLESCTHLIVVCTENYRCSAWGNQEVGYAIARKEVDIIPFFWKGTDRHHFGFIEGFQALPDYVNEENLENIVNKVLERFGLKK